MKTPGGLNIAGSFLFGLSILATLSSTVYAAAGSEGASFLDIPVGATPAGMGSAYTAMASDAYAPIWNPAGLANLDSVQFAGMHLVYLESLHYEFASTAIPLHDGTRGLGASIQYLGSGDIDGRDNVGGPAPSFNTTFAAYSLAYGQRMTDKLSLGVTGKAITESISDASARAYAADFGGMYHCTDRLTLGSAVANLGSSIKFVDQKDPLPLAFRLGAAYEPTDNWRLGLEGIYRRDGLTSARSGLEWSYQDDFALRAGYDTSHVKGLSALSGVSAGVSLYVWGQEVGYTWMPYGDLGTTSYISLVIRFTKTPAKGHERSERDDDDMNMRSIDDTSSSHKIREPKHEKVQPEGSSGYDTLYDLLNEDERKAMQNPGTSVGKENQ